MSSLADVAPAFVEMAHRIVWASAATVDAKGRPRQRILHPFWLWDGDKLEGWVATGPTPVKRADLERSPNLSLNYWAPGHDTCTTVHCAGLDVSDGGHVRGAAPGAVPLTCVSRNRPARTGRRRPDVARMTPDRRKLTTRTHGAPSSGAEVTVIAACRRKPATRPLRMPDLGAEVPVMSAREEAS